MRKTLHEYTIEQLEDLDCTAISNVLSYANLTNRKPNLEDFIGKNAIFKGDWEVVDLIGGYIELENKKFNCKVRFDSYGDIVVISDNTYPSVCNRIEDLPLEIEFNEEEAENLE